MPRYLIERAFDPDLDEEQLQSLGARSKAIAYERFHDLRWEHSHVVTNDEGDVRSFCVYQAPSPDRIHDHARELGYHTIVNIYEIGGDISPDDFPL